MYFNIQSEINTYLFWSSISATCEPCQLKVIFANEVLTQSISNEYSEFQGTYEISKTVNGKSSWKSGNLAISYNSNRKSWVIGYGWDDVIGTAAGFIYSKQRTEYDCPQQVPKDKWKYYIKDGDGERWQYANSNDIIIECEGKNDKMYLCTYVHFIF